MSPIKALIISLTALGVTSGLALSYLLPLGVVLLIGIGDGAPPVWMKLLGLAILVATGVAVVVLAWFVVVALVWTIWPLRK